MPEKGQKSHHFYALELRFYIRNMQQDISIMPLFEEIQIAAFDLKKRRTEDDKEKECTKRRARDDSELQ